MSFKTRYPEYAAIEGHVRHAHAERSVAVAQTLVAFVLAVGRGLQNLSNVMGRGYAADRDRRAIEADSFLKRSVPKY
jgi:hypothetical protein